MRFLSALLALVLMATPVASQVSVSSPDTSAIAAAPARTPICSLVTIPTGNNVINSNAETQFVSTCRYAPGMITTGMNTRIDSRFLFGVAATIPTLRGRVILARSATPNLSTCVAASQCVIILDTGNVGGLTAGSNLYANADVSLTFPSPTTVEGAGQLNFQSGATAVLAIAAMSASNTSSPPITIPWDTTINESYLVYTATWSTASNSSYIQLRQQTIK